MKRTLFILLITALAFSAKSQYIQPGEFQLNAGLGFSNYGMPIYVGGDFGVVEDLSIGGELSYRRDKESFFGGEYTHNIIGFIVNANYHFNSVFEIPDPWNVYAGLNVGFYSWNTKSSVAGFTYSGSGSSGLGVGLQVGGRYYFNDMLGINLEFGGGNQVSGGKVGVTVKF